MTDAFHKFPHTPHLLWLSNGLPRDDKVLKPAEVIEFLSGEVIVEEKVDGANLGLSLGPDGRVRAQSRGNYLASGRSHAQWNLLWPWLAERRAILENGLSGGLMLFGEWCYARHTVPYDSLPDWFLGFDIFELESRRFWSVDRRNAWLHECGLVSVSEINRGRIQLKQVSSFLATSAVGHVPMEGIYLRHERGDWLQSRAKVVSAAFNQQIEQHWTRRTVVPNQLAMAPVS
jgi:ATP-dependent RNA circularization protein (DNA/RNA ligase family)